MFFFVKNSRNSSINRDLHEDDLENIFVEIQKPSKPFFVTWCRLPEILFKDTRFFEYRVSYIE